MEERQDKSSNEKIGTLVSNMGFGEFLRTSLLTYRNHNFGKKN